MEAISKVVRIQEPGVRIIGKQTGFELEFHSEFWILSSEFLQNASCAIGSECKDWIAAGNRGFIHKVRAITLD